ncbi:tyrosine-type recombinase/integrase [Carnobacterium maltaromaticum]|uniref:tyrosine-type recombinase/integrase n=1 Tax=Carnobacterium maltaromaticum TaxID=2751 RepID=UPI0039BE398A
MEKSKKHEYVFSYTTKKDKQLWGFKYPYYNNLNQRKFKEKRQFTSEKLAFRALLEFQLLIEKEQLIFADNYDITVKQWSEKWYNDNLNDWAKSTQATHKNIVFNHIIPRLGMFNLRKLSRSIYKKEFVDALLKEHAEVTVQRWHATFMSIVNAAVLDDVLDKNRFKQIVFNVQQTDRFFNNDELLKFLTYLDTVNFDSFEFRYKVLFTTFLYSGMRKGEALGLTWNDINFKEKHITVNKSRDRHGMKPPKTKTSYRTIDVDDTLIDLLRRYKIYEKANCLKKGSS